MWLPHGGALKIENLQFTQYSIIYYNAYTQPISVAHTHTERGTLILLVISI